jgi:GNAT superfamily N-acetyltransferase
VEICVKKGFAYLADIVVTKEARGKGVGRKLYEAFEKHCKKKNVKTIASIVQITNEGMQNFSTKMGFEQGGKFYCYEKQI